jgi:hypothetical protein
MFILHKYLEQSEDKTVMTEMGKKGTHSETVSDYAGTDFTLINRLHTTKDC